MESEDLLHTLVMKKLGGNLSAAEELTLEECLAITGANIKKTGKDKKEKGIAKAKPKAKTKTKAVRKTVSKAQKLSVKKVVSAKKKKATRKT